MKQDYDPDDGCRDYEYKQTGRPVLSSETSMADQSLEAARKAAFEPVTITEGGKHCTKPLIEVYTKSLTQAAARGDENAQDELDKLQQYNSKLSEKELRDSKSPVAEAIERQRRICNSIRDPLIAVSIRLMREIYPKFVEVKGPIAFSMSLFPYYLDMNRIAEVLRYLVRVRKKKPKPDSQVGYRRTPVHSRFTSERNPRKNAKPKDVWAALNDDLNRPIVIVSTKGKKVKNTVREVGFRQLFRDAINGKRRARAQVRKFIIRLSEKGMLSPPERPRRFRRKSGQISPQVRTMSKATEVMAAPSLKRDIVENFTRRYGPVPDFITDYERQLPKLEDIEGWAELAELAKQRAAEKKVAKPVVHKSPAEADVPVPPYPARPRTRTTPLSRAPQTKAVRQRRNEPLA